MKVLILTPLSYNKIIDYKEGRKDINLQDLEAAWIEYQKKHLECSLNLDFEYRAGSDWYASWLSSYAYFSEQDIVNLENEINSLIDKKEIAGLIIDPILTIEEENQYLARYMSAKTLERLFDKFSDLLPIFYDRSCTSSGMIFSTRESLYNKMAAAYKKRGYDLPPSISVDECNTTHDLESMFNCLIDNCLKIYKTKENGKNQTLKKVVDKGQNVAYN